MSSRPAMSRWVEQLQSQGRYTFTRVEAQVFLVVNDPDALDFTEYVHAIETGIIRDPDSPGYRNI